MRMSINWISFQIHLVSKYKILQHRSRSNCVHNPFLDKVMSLDKWHIGVQERHLMFEKCHAIELIFTHDGQQQKNSVLLYDCTRKLVPIWYVYA